MIIACGRFWLCSKVFNFWETCRLRSFSTRHLQAPKNNPGTFHHPAGAQRLRRPARKSAIPLWFHDVPHGWCPEAFTRQHVSMADNRQNDTQPVQPSQPPMASKSIPNPTGPLQTAQISWLMVQSRLRRHRPNSRNGQLRSMISALSASSRSRTPMADRIAWLRDGMVEVTRATNAEKRPNNSK